MARVADSNIPATPLRWSVAAAGREFDLAEATLERKIRDAQVFPDAGGCYTTKQLTEAIFGSLFRERLRRLTEEADKTALANQVARGGATRAEGINAGDGAGRGGDDRRHRKFRAEPGRSGPNPAKPGVDSGDYSRPSQVAGQAAGILE